MPEAAAAAGTPARVSIAYCIAPAAATPPGTTRPKAVEASCEVTTGPMCSARTESFCTAHMQAKLPTCSAIIAPHQSGLKSSRRSNPPKTWSSAGARRYSEIAVTASSSPRLARPPALMSREATRALGRGAAAPSEAARPPARSGLIDSVRRSTYSRSRIWIEAATGIATSAPITPSSAAPNSTDTIVMNGWTCTVRFWICGWITWFSNCW